LSNTAVYVGIDIGTSGVKAVLLAPDGALLGQATAPLSVSRPQPLWSEQDPEDWWAAVGQAVTGLDAGLRAAVQGIGLSGQMHGATLLGDDDRPLRPAILWNDGRSGVECAELERAEPRSRTITGNIAMPGFTAPKLQWVRRHEPAVHAAVRSVLLPKDYVRLRMTGDKASDVSDSAGTLWLDVGARRWSEPMLAACGLSTAHMPALHEGTGVTGALRAGVAEAWGMRRVPVVAGGGDNAAGAVGVGIAADGDAMLSLGTSGVIFVATDGFRPNAARAVHAFCHCLPGLWHQMSVHLSAASCVDWAARLVGASDVGSALALAQAAGVANGPELFLPYLSGERTPHNDPLVRGAFLGLGHETDRGRLVAAVLEGVAFSLADGLDALRQAGTQVRQLTVIGGGARSRHWGAIIAAALGTPLAYVEGGEVGPALGAARLASVGVGGESLATACARPPFTHVIEPDTALAARLAPLRARFQSAYARIREH
jgi:xylulokinase